MQSKVALKPGSYHALYIDTPDLESPLAMEGSIVRRCLPLSTQSNSGGSCLNKIVRVCLRWQGGVRFAKPSRSASDSGRGETSEACLRDGWVVPCHDIGTAPGENRSAQSGTSHVPVHQAVGAPGLSGHPRASCLRARGAFSKQILTGSYLITPPRKDA